MGQCPLRSRKGDSCTGPKDCVPYPSSMEEELLTSERVYRCIWEVPSWPQLQGIHMSQGKEVYHRVLNLGPNGTKLPFKAVRRRRAKDLNEAELLLCTAGPKSL